MTSSEDTARWRRVREIVADALDASPKDRAAFIRTACGGDEALRREVESLVSADADQPADFLASPAAALADAVIGSGSHPDATPDRWMGREVGGYRIERLLGEGGMGLVFEALQENPRRLVALKLVRGGVFVDDLTIRLFQREVEALARLQHAGIASIYESGRTADGQHYFAMELVAGLPLDAYLSASCLVDRKAERRRRLAIFLEIAEAIAYAHQRGVIHRDLKPSNVIVREDGRVKVLDFGLARITEGDVSLHTVATSSGAIRGTLPYMSPEQAAGDPAAIDLRSDVYALGVILFEMLTGQLPIEVRASALPDALRAIAGEPPRRPTSIVPSLESDLETILLASLEKDPGSRYATVDAFAGDVRRFLDDLPILARPASTIAQIRRLARRHRGLVAFAAVTLATLLAGVVGTTAGMLRARSAERDAREETETARAVSAFLENLFLVSDPGEAKGNSITARELLDQAVIEVDSALVAEPRVRGRVLGVLGQVYRNLGLYAEARPLLERSLAVRSANPGENPIELARSYYSLAGLLRRLGQFEAAGAHYEEALRIRERVLDPNHEELAASYQGLANLYFDQARYAEALPLSERALAMVRVSLGEDHFDFPSFLSSYGFMLNGNGELERAREVFEETVRRREKAVGPDHPSVGYDLQVLADHLAEMDLVAEAIPVARRALAISEATIGADHPTAAEARLTVGKLELRVGRPEVAEAEERRALAVLERALGVDHYLIGMSLDLLADAVGAQGRSVEALELSARAGVILERTLAADHEAFARHREIEARIRAHGANPKSAATSPEG